jgi:hypothetical protein
LRWRAGAGFDPERPGRRWDAVLLDIDHTPGQLLAGEHADFYTEEGLRRLKQRLKPGGVFALWSNDKPEPEFLERLRGVFGGRGGACLCRFANPLLDEKTATASTWRGCLEPRDERRRGRTSVRCAARPGPFERAMDIRKRWHRRCGRCQLLFVEDEFLPDPAAERDRYAKHRNGPHDAGYVAFLRQAVLPALPHLKPAMRGLDFGCGHTPTLCGLLAAEGLACENYDPFFHPGWPEGAFDYVFATEVVEHFHRAGAGLGQAGAAEPRRPADGDDGAVGGSGAFPHLGVCQRRNPRVLLPPADAGLDLRAARAGGAGPAPAARERVAERHWQNTKT